MSLSLRLRLALKLCWREWKAGELTILLVALLIAISSHTAIGFFTDRIEKAMTYKAGDMVGGDLVIHSSRPLKASGSESWQSRANAAQLRHTTVHFFSSVVLHGEEMLLVSVKAVGDNYPLKASLKTSTSAYGEGQATRNGPPTGEAWVDARILNDLGMEVGQTLTLGAVTLKVTRVLIFEPDRGGSMYSFTPRVMMNKADLERAEVIQDGSRVDYHTLFSGESDAITAFKSWMTPRLEPGQKIITPGEQQPTVGGALTRAQRFMGLASLIAVLLAAVAIAVSGKHYSTRHFDASAILRCLGCKQNDLVFIYLFQMLLIALVGSILGIALGWLAQFILLYLLKDLLPDVVPAADWHAAWSGLGLGLVVLLGFTLPSVMRLRAVSPLRVLRKDLKPLPLSGWLVYGSALLIVIALMWFYTGSLILTLSVLGGAVLVFLLTLLLIALLFFLLEKSSGLLSLSMRAGLRNLLRRKGEALVQTLAFALTLMAMLVVIFIRTDLLNNWQQSLPEDAPNHFVINILPDKVATFESYLREQQLVSSKIYPMSRGRLIEINGVSVKQAVTKEEENNESLNRELNLTWSDTVQEDNEILAGRWWQKDNVSGFPEVSIESRLAEKLGIELGDRLTFFTGRQNWQAEVTSIRSVKWESFRPNFYFVFNPSSIEHLPATYMTSFYMAPEQKVLLKGMVKAFPAITVFEMDAVLSQLKAIISQVIVAIEYVLLFVLAAGLMVTLAAVQASLDERLQEGALMRTLGAQRTLIRRSQWSEFGSMGLIAGIVAVLGTEFVSFLASRYIFQTDYSPLWWAWAFVPLVAALLLALLGTFSARKVLTKSPMLVLREGQ